MSKDEGSNSNKTAGMAVLVGVFVWIVFDSFALGLLAGAATFFLMRRDAETDAASEFDDEHQ